MKKIGIIISILLFFIGLVIGMFLTAYWANRINMPDDEDEEGTVTIHKALIVNTLIITDINKEVEGGKCLCPQAITAENAVHSVKRSFKVVWESEDDNPLADGHEGVLVIEKISLYTEDKQTDLLEGDDPLFGVDILTKDLDILLGGEALDILLEIYFKRMPKDPTEYNLVGGKDLKLIVTFTIVPEEYN